MLNNEIRQFFQSSNEVKTNGIMNMDNLVKFYEFDLDAYYGLNNNHSYDKNKKMIFDKSESNTITTQSNLINGNLISTNILSIANENKSESLNLNKLDNESDQKAFSENNINKRNTNSNTEFNNNPQEYNSFINKVLEKVRMYLKLENFPNKIRKFIIELLIRCILILKTSLIKWLISQILNNNDSNTNFINKNNLLLEWVNISDKYFFEHHIVNSENTQDLTEEEVTKFLDFIDPIENSVTNNLLVCEFCDRFGPRKLSGRLIHLKNEMWGHVNCTIKSRGVFETNEGNLINVSQILNKIKSYKCVLCKKLGATVVCEFKKCGKNYHFACALAKQSVFTKSGKFFCLKCSNSKEEIVTSFETKRRIVVIKNNEFINDARINYIVDYNFNKIFPKYLVGSILKFGNTSVLKFFNLTKKELAPENYDINVIKLVDNFINEKDKINQNDNYNKEFIQEEDFKKSNQTEKSGGKDIKVNIEVDSNNDNYNNKNLDLVGIESNLCNKKFLLLQINENGICLSELENLTNKEIDYLFSKYKIINNFEKTDFILNTENENFTEENNHKTIKQAINIQTDKIITLNPSKDNFESLMKNTIMKFNGKILVYDFEFLSFIIFL